ncbi:MAG TPA: hypothetical protein DD400_00070 [Rhodospirillaceae bacterium]|nr:hypothetical protein [Rhodospirillaceae bacterium]
MKRVDILSAAFFGLVALSLSVPAWASEELEAVEESMGKGLPQMDVSLFPSVLFWLAATFLLFFIMMQTIGVPGIQKTKARRKGIVDQDLLTARNASDEAQNIREVNEAALDDARIRAQKTVNDIIQVADSEATEQREKQQQDLSHRLQVAEENLNAVRKKALEDTPKFINDLVIEIVDKVTQPDAELRGSQGKG